MWGNQERIEPEWNRQKDLPSDELGRNIECKNFSLVSFRLPLPHLLLRWTPRGVASLWAHYDPPRLASSLAIHPSSDSAPCLSSGSRPGPSQDDRQARLTVPVSGGKMTGAQMTGVVKIVRRGKAAGQSWGATVISVMKELKHCLSFPSLRLTSFLGQTGGK